MNLRPAAAKTLLCCGVALALLPMSAQAWILDWTLGLGVQHSDNIGRRTTNEVSGNVIRPTVEFSATENGDTTTASITGLMTYSRYTGTDFDPQLGLNAGANVQWQVLPQRILWSFNDYASQQPIDQFGTQSPDNTQTTNVLSTGPTFLFRISDAAAARVELRYINSYAEETAAFNSDRGVASAQLLRRINPLATISGNISYETVMLDNPTDAAPEFDRLQLYGTYARTSSQLTLSADAGWNRVEPDGLDSRDGVLARLTLTYELTPISTIEAGAVHDLSDAAANLLGQAANVDALLLPVTSGTSFGSGTITADVFEENTLNAGYGLNGERTVWRADGYWSRQDYDNNPVLDQKRRGVVATVEYRVTRQATLSVFGVQNWQNYEQSDLNVSERDYGVRFRYSILRNLELSAEVARASRSSSAALDDYEETRMFLGLILRRAGG